MKWQSYALGAIKAQGGAYTQPEGIEECEMVREGFLEKTIH